MNHRPFRKYSFLIFLLFLTYFFRSNSSTILITPLPSNNKFTDINNQVNLTVSSSNDQSVILLALKQYFGCLSLNKGVCVQCQDGYYLDQNAKCSRISQNCKKYNTDELTCTQCYNGYDKIDGNCLIPNTTMLIDHCVIWDQYLCQKCDKSYYLTWRGKCVAIDQNCRLWNSSGYCLKCNRGYYSNGLFSCIQNSTLSKNCPQNYFLNSNFQCQKIVVNCETWDYYTGKCVNCLQGFDLNINTFTCSCQNKTQYCSGNCIQFNRQKQCINCNSGYILKNNSICQSTFYKASNPPPNCQKFNSVTNLCQKCADQYKYQPNQNKCKFNIRNCLVYGNQNCLKCIPGFVLFSNQCILQAQNFTQSQTFGCSVWDFQNQNCLQCNSKWTKNSSGLCIFVNSTLSSTSTDQLCQVRDFSTKVCINCIVGYMLTSNGSCQKSLTNCAQSDATKKCTLCQDGYLLIEHKCVTIQKCQSIDSHTGQCNVCVTNYILSQGKCYSNEEFGNLIFNYADAFPDKLQNIISIQTN